jgi:hypothetical protein
MTYSIQSVSALSDIPAAVVAFAVARGWGSGGAANIVHPITGQSYTMSISGDRFTISASGGKDATFRLPYTLGTYPSGPVVSLPSQLHMFGNNSPYTSPDSEPYLAFVVECGYNLYRHFYVGSLVRAGDYTDGDLLACNNFYEGESSFLTSVSYLYEGHRFLFGGYSSNAQNGGGAKITHVDNPITWREFDCPMDGGSSANYTENQLDGSEIFGGNRDGTNDGFVYRGHADYGAAQILIPVNLYVSKGDLGLNYRIIPVGHASGVRLVDMKNLSPGQQVSIGSDDWRVFPEFSKSATTTITRSSGAWWPAESSYNLGLAYRE